MSSDHRSSATKKEAPIFSLLSHDEPAPRDLDNTALGTVKLVNVSKDYGRTKALTGANISIQAGELFSILGPSGSGKSTLLHLIAGFTEPSAGEIYISGIPITPTPAHKRGLGVVFQSYNLFPHMNVFENVAYPLTVRGMKSTTASERVREVLALVGMDGAESKLPSQLSGGQQQRIAIARAIVFEPAVLLMDEPMSALDRKIRDSMQVEFRRLQRRLGITMIYVTHDQEEALMMSDRLAVVKDGNIEHCGSPQDVYNSPRSLFVAQFIGDSHTLEGELVSRDGSGSALARLKNGDLVGCKLFSGEVGQTVALNVRTERLTINDLKPADPGTNLVLDGKVSEILFKGITVRYVVETAVGELIATSINPESANAISRGDNVVLTSDAQNIRCFRS